jgi:DNA-binding response OmpR family regulator
MAIEKSIERFEFYKALWAIRGVEGIRADTMTEGIAQAIAIERSETDELFFISIVADDIDFLPQLSILSNETAAPILVAASKKHYTEDEHHDALNNGADFYAAYCGKPEKDLDGVLSAIHSIDRRFKKQKSVNGIIAHGDILLVVDLHKAFIMDVEIKLTVAEMRVFHFFMRNRGDALSHRKLFNSMSNDVYDDLTSDVIYGVMKRLRKKIRDAAEIDFIETVKDVGYRLKTKAEIMGTDETAGRGA